MDEATIHRRRWYSLAVLCLSLVMIIVGNTVLNVALPTLVEELDATSSQLQWMVDSYALVFACLLLSAGALGDRFGRKGALTIGLAVFGVGSAVSAMATSVEHLIATRAVMGLGAALVMPATLSILTSVFPAQERARAIAIWAGLAGSGAAIGPIAGGWLLEHFWWGSVFFVNLPIVAAALLAGRFLVPTSRDPAQPPLDPVGALLSIAGLGALLYAIIEGPNHGWSSPATLSGFAAAAVVLGAFAGWELRIAHPMLDLRYFANPTFSAASGAITLVFFAMFGAFFLLTQYLQLVLGYTAFQAGLRTLPMATTLMVVAPLGARVAERFGTKRVVTAGLMMLSAGLALLSTVDASSRYGRFVPFLVVLAVGMALTMPPATASIMASLPSGKAGVGSAVNDTTRELGGALGVAVLGSLLASQYGSALSGAVRNLPQPVATAASRSLGGAIGAAGQLGGPAGSLLAEAAKSAYVAAMGTALLVSAALVLAAAAVIARFFPAAGVPREDHRPVVAVERPAATAGTARAPVVVDG